MEICNGGVGKYSHNEIVHNERDCPCCMVMDEKFGLESEISKLKQEIDKLNAEV